METNILLDLRKKRCNSRPLELPSGSSIIRLRHKQFLGVGSCEPGAFTLIFIRKRYHFSDLGVVVDTGKKHEFYLVHVNQGAGSRFPMTEFYTSSLPQKHCDYLNSRRDNGRLLFMEKRQSLAGWGDPVFLCHPLPYKTNGIPVSFDDFVARTPKPLRG